jgi:acyl-CoA synthetase (AMP-forming)/AMP-acid ligase II
MSLVVGNLLERRALLDGACKAIVCDGRHLTYREFDRLSRQIATLLRAQDIGPGDRVAALLRNGIEYCALYYAVARLGAVLCPVNWRLASAEIDYILSNSGAQMLLFDPVFRETVNSLPEQAELRHCTAFGNEPDNDFLVGMNAYEPIEGLCRAGPDDPLLIVHTSGSTGKPKGVVLTQSQMVWASITMAATLDYRRADRGLISAPMFHVGGLSFATLFVHIGATAVLMPEWDPDAVLDLIGRESINHFFAVATMLDGLTRSEKFADADFGNLRWIMSGGGPLPVSLIDIFGERDVPLILSYGTTETAGPATVVPVADILAKRGSSGLPFFHTDLRIVDASMQVIEDHSSGQILIKGPHVSSRYWQGSEATAAAFDDGWLRTGDRGYFDRDGYLYIEGRIKEMIITGGENVHPAEVENVLQTYPGVTDVAVLGIPDVHWGERICAVVYSEGSSSPTLADLKVHCAPQLATYKFPTTLITQSEPLPRNVMGKLLRDDIRKITIR